MELERGFDQRDGEGIGAWLLRTDDMGLGKTVQAVAASHALFKAGIVKRGLLLVPGARERDPRAP